MREPAVLPLTFRPSLWLRAVAGTSGLLCGLAAFGSTYLFLRQGVPLRLAAAGVLGAPFLLAWGILRRRLIVGLDGLEVRGPLQSKTIPWLDVLAVEQTRRSFVIITAKGDISAGWIGSSQRDLLFRKVLELSKLSLEPKQPRWGVVARFIRAHVPARISPEQILRARGGEQDTP